MAPKTDETPGTITEASLKKLKVTELREKLAENDLDTKGVKDDLVKRLVDHFGSKGGVNTQSAAADEPAVGKANEADVPDTAPAAPSASQPSAAPLSEEEKAKIRAERFGIPFTSSEKKQDKKKGGGIVGLGNADTQEEFEKRKKRAERFGLPIPVNKAEEHEKKKARAERFGLPAPPPSATEIAAKLKAREERFGKKI
jgi:SAP domain-containing ribonucleoprotein